MRDRSWHYLAAVSLFSVPAHAIPPPPPPPDPAAVIEADRLARELLADLDEGSLRYQTVSAVSGDALNWLATVHPDVREPAVRDAFYAAVFARAGAVWPEERSNIEAAVGNQFRFMVAADLIAVRDFIESPAGKNFARTLVGSNFGLADRAAAAVLYRRLFPEFPEMLAVAQKPAAE